MNRPIAMTTFAARRDRKDARTTGGAAEDDPAGKQDYALIIVGVVYVAFAVFGYFAAGEITPF